MPMSTATADETTTDPWWEDGRNVTMLARWYVDTFMTDHGYMGIIPDTQPGEVLISMYERPWDNYEWWALFQEERDAALDKLLQQ